MYLWIGLFITAALLSSNGLCADPLQADGTTISAQSAKGSLFRLTSSNFSPQLAKSYCSNSALEPTTDPTYQADKYFCLVPFDDYHIGVTMIFENKRPQVSPSVDQQDLSIALNGGVRTLTLEAILTNNAYVLPEQGDLYSTFNLTRNNAAVRFEGFPCNGSELEPNLPPIPITPPRFSDVAVAFSGILDLLLVRAARTKANVGVGGAALVTNLDHVAVTDRAVKVGNWTYFGIFNIQPAQEPYTPQTRVAGIRYHCEGVVEQQDVASS